MDATRIDSSEIEQRWNDRFIEADLHPWGREPNATVAEIVAPLTPGRALDLGAGEGRNTHFLAERGWRVTAVDISSVALETLREDCWGESWDITTIHADLRDWRPPAQEFDLVLLSFVHLEQPHRGELHRAAAAALEPGGTLVLVAHDRSNIHEGTGGPQDTAVLPNAAEVTDEFGALAIERCDVIERPVEGAERPARDLVVVARRPPTN